MRSGDIVFEKDWSRIQRNLNHLFAICNIKGYVTVRDEDSSRLTVEFKVLPEAKEKCRVKLARGKKNG